MFSIKIVEVGIGLAFTYLIVSTITSGLLEALKWSLVNLKGRHLRQKLSAMFNSKGSDLVSKIYDHPAVSSFFNEELKGVSSIAAKDMSLAFLQTLSKDFGSAPGTQPGMVAKIQAEMSKFSFSEDTKRRLNVVLEQGEDQMDAIKNRLDGWFDRELKAINQLYVNHVRWFLLAISVAVVLGFNVDSITIGKTLWVDDEVREAVVSASEKWLNDHPKADCLIHKEIIIIDTTMTDSPATSKPHPKMASAKKGLDQLEKELGGMANSAASGDSLKGYLNQVREAVTAADPLPLGWDCDEVDAALKTMPKEYIFMKFLGLLITIGAVVVGGPYWYDIMKNLINIRSIMKGFSNPGKKEEQA